MVKKPVEHTNLAESVVAAVKTLRRGLTCGDPRAELRAAKVILDLSNKLAERDLLERVRALEMRVKGVSRRG